MIPCLITYMYMHVCVHQMDPRGTVLFGCVQVQAGHCSLHTLCLGNEKAQQHMIVAHEWYQRQCMDIPSEVCGPGDIHVKHVPVRELLGRTVCVLTNWSEDATCTYMTSV